MAEDPITGLARELGMLCVARSTVLVLAESCTGGGVAEAITRIPGSSAWLDRGFVTYSNEAKVEMLGVDARTLRLHGAVSEAVAREMAVGALRASRAGLAASITGIAGPGGGSPDKPVGLVWFGWAHRDGRVEVARRVFPGDRTDVRNASIISSIQGLVMFLR